MQFSEQGQAEAGRTSLLYLEVQGTSCLSNCTYQPVIVRIPLRKELISG